MHTEQPVQKRIVLLGAGNANLQVVKRWKMEPQPGIQLTLVNDTLEVPYSGMIPGCIAGQYRPEEITLDVFRLCSIAGVELIKGKAHEIDPESRLILLRDRPALAYDVLSLNLGSQPHIPDRSFPEEKTLRLKPLHSLLQRIEIMEDTLSATRDPFRVVLVGAGAGGFEICMALKKRWGHLAHVDFEVVTGGDCLISGGPSAVSRTARRVLEQAGVSFRTGARVREGDQGVLILENGEKVPCDLCIWATQAKALNTPALDSFARDDHGFVITHDNLQTLSHPDVFATGDCGTMEFHLDLPKAGIFSVREGPVLWDNLLARLHEKSLRPYRPQPLYLFLLNTCDGKAIMNYGGLAGHGRWAFRWKDFIDRRWMRKFHDAYAEPMQKADNGSEVSMRCGGCGAKVGTATLRTVLERLNLPEHDTVIIGAHPGDDASVHRPPQGKVELQSTDFFRPFVDDPFLFGRIAALNAMSDLFAMNAKPFSAQAIVTVPFASNDVRTEQLYQVLSGAQQAFKQEDVLLLGGHTTESMELQIGFTITGYAEESDLFRKDALCPGDVLVLTKPLGSGALLRAAMMGQCSSVWFESLLAGLTASSGPASHILARHGIKACTDVTGFGLAGHLLEMLEGSDISAELEAGNIPLYPGFLEVANSKNGNFLSTLHPENEMAVNQVDASSVDSQAWLYDPQTAGGLLAGVPGDRADKIINELRQEGYVEASVIGRVIDKSGDASRIVVTK